MTPLLESEIQNCHSGHSAWSFESSWREKQTFSQLLSHSFSLSPIHMDCKMVLMVTLFSNLFSKIWNLKHRDWWNINLSRQEVSNERVLNFVRPFRIFGPLKLLTFRRWGEGTNFKGALPYYWSACSDMSCSFLFDGHLARSKKRVFHALKHVDDTYWRSSWPCLLPSKAIWRWF